MSEEKFFTLRFFGDSSRFFRIGVAPLVIERIKEGLPALISSMGNVERAYFFAPQNLIDMKTTEGAICLVHWSALPSEEEIRWENKITDFFKESFGLPVDVGVNRFSIL